MIDWAASGNLTTELFTNESHILKTLEISYCLEKTDKSTKKNFSNKLLHWRKS